MTALMQFRTKAKALPDLLNWGFLIDDGIVLGKDGSLLAGFFYRGKDIQSSTADERNYLTKQVNAALNRLGAGWAVWVDAVRFGSSNYSPAGDSHFPDSVTAMIDDERRAMFMREDHHFESEFALTVQYTPPFQRNTRIQDFMYDDDGKADESVADRVLRQFKRNLEELQDTLSVAVTLRRMRSFEFTDEDSGRTVLRDELINYLQASITGEMHPVNLPSYAAYCDVYLGGQEVYPGDTPKIGDKFICAVAIEGFPADTYPGILAILDHLAISYRFSSRFVFLDQHEAQGALKKFRSEWRQKQRGFVSQVFKTQGGMVNEDAVHMARDVEHAITEASSGLVSFGYYSPVIILMGESREILEENARLIQREVQKLGFAARKETINTMEAWLGTLPGHVVPNLRRPLVHTLNLADLIPLAGVWAGNEFAPCPMYPKLSPPLLHAATSGATPFRLNLHVGDLGHTLIFGPTGAGKSTLLATVVAQFFRYPGASVTCFDKGNSMLALCLGAGGAHYDLGGDHAELGLCPLAALDTAGDVAWAADWLATCFELQANRAPLPHEKVAIMEGLKLLKADPEGRTLTDFSAAVQDQTVRDALRHYTLDGGMGRLLDSQADGFQVARFTVCEIEELMQLGEKSLVPVLLYLFRRFEKSLKGQPALLVLDEAWLMLGHPTFKAKIREWLKVLRKANCAVILATQSLSDAANSGILDVLVENCPTKILLPNAAANQGGTPSHPGPRDLYAMFGLNARQVEILTEIEPKRHYYYLSAEGRRVFELGLGPVTLSFVAVSSKDDVRRVRQLHAEHGSSWPMKWMQERRVNFAPYLAAAARIPARGEVSQPQELSNAA